MDNQAAYYNAASMLIALYSRLSTRKGTTIDSSATEIGIGLIGPTLLDATANQRPTRRSDFPPGNRLLDQPAAPHGVYKCLGDDRWVAIAVFTDKEWQALVSVIDDGAVLGSDDRFADQTSRYGNQDALDAHIERWTSQRDGLDITRLLQSRGVQAGLVQNAEDLLDFDPQVRARNLYFSLNHPVVGKAEFEGVPIRFSRAELIPWRSAPLLGEDNRYVFRDVLGYSLDDIEAFERSGSI
jgi:crotonobetainyl-CoA:carnitine CoA-transferase CaiB-like acyl-CoA transferase